MKQHIQVVIYQTVDLFHAFTACETVAKQTSTAARRVLRDPLASASRGPALFQNDAGLRGAVKQFNSLYSNSLEPAVSCFMGLVTARETLPGNVVKPLTFPPSNPNSI